MSKSSNAALSNKTWMSTRQRKLCNLCLQKENARERLNINNIVKLNINVLISIFYTLGNFVSIPSFVVHIHLPFVFIFCVFEWLRRKQKLHLCHSFPRF